MGWERGRGIGTPGGTPSILLPGPGGGSGGGGGEVGPGGYDPDNALFIPSGYTAGPLALPSNVNTLVDADGVINKWNQVHCDPSTRVAVVTGADIPGAGQPWRPTNFAIRHERRSTDPLVATGHRSEVVRDDQSRDFLPTSGGAVRWNVISYFFPVGWKFGSTWLCVGQWKGRKSPESPPTGYYIVGSNLVLNLENITSPALKPVICDLNDYLGQWIRVAVGEKLSETKTGGSAGWVKAYLNGAVAIPQTTTNTLYSGTTYGSLYPKKGIYRGGGWDSGAGTTHVAYEGHEGWFSTEADAKAFAGFN